MLSPPGAPLILGHISILKLYVDQCFALSVKNEHKRVSFKWKIKGPVCKSLFALSHTTVTETVKEEGI